MTAALCVFGYGGFGLKEAVGQTACPGRPLHIQGGAGLFGCSFQDDSCPTTPEGTPVGAYRLSGTGIAFARLQIDALGPGAATLSADGVVDGIKDDVFVSAEGGQADVFPNGDAVGVCAFTTAPRTDIAVNAIEVLTVAYPEVPGECADPLRCIRCTTNAGPICTIECAGRIPSDELVDGDSFGITVTFSHSFNDSQPGPPGMMRFDGFADHWPEFLPEGSLPDFVTTEGCNGGAPDEMVLNNNDFLGINDLAPEAYWIQSFGIDDTSLGGACTIHTILNGSMPLAGVFDLGEVEVKRGPISLYGTLCNRSGTIEDCPAPVR